MPCHPRVAGLGFSTLLDPGRPRSSATPRRHTWRRCRFPTRLAQPDLDVDLLELDHTASGCAAMNPAPTARAGTPAALRGPDTA